MRPQSQLYRPFSLATQILVSRRPLRPVYGPLGEGSSTASSLKHCYGARRKIHSQSLLDTSLHTAHDLITGLHAVTYTPWFLTIPLVALGVNILFRLPFTINTQRIARERTTLAPLLRAWAHKHFRDVARENIPPERRADVASRRYLKSTRELYREWGVQQWKMYGSVLSFPFWLLAIEAIRRMCGGPYGLLGALFRRKQEAASDGAAGAATTSTASPETPADGSLLDASNDVAGAADLANSANSLYEPSLTTGGCLWFQDLTVADPYHILPFALSAVLVANLIPKSDAARRALFGLGPPGGDAGLVQMPQSRVMRGLHRGLLLVSASVGVITLHFPSAIHLYWLASSGINFLMVRGVSRFMPVPRVATKTAARELPFIKGPPP